MHTAPLPSVQRCSYYPSCCVMGSLGLAVSRALFFQLPPSQPPPLGPFWAVWLFPSGEVWCTTHIKHDKEVWRTEICFFDVVFISHYSVLIPIVHLVNSTLYNLVHPQSDTFDSRRLGALNVRRLFLSGWASNRSERTELIIMSKASGMQQAISEDILIETLLQDLPL